MNDRAFLDTNLLVYLYTSTELEKRDVVTNLVQNVKPHISTQVLKELANTLRKKFKLEWPKITAVLEEVSSNFTIHLNTPTTISAAVEVAERYQYSFYDSLIIAAALEVGGTELYSEDMQDGQIINGYLTIVNPLKLKL